MARYLHLWARGTRRMQRVVLHESGRSLTGQFREAEGPGCAPLADWQKQKARPFRSWTWQVRLAATDEAAVAEAAWRSRWSMLGLSGSAKW